MVNTSLDLGRRKFLQSVLPAGTMFCLGCTSLMAHSSGKKTALYFQQKNQFLEDSGLTVEEVFQFTFRDNFIPLMQAMAKDMGRDNLIARLETGAAATITNFMAEMAKDMPTRDLATLKTFTAELMKTFPYNKALVYEVTKDTDTEFEVRYSECLYAKTFIEAGAADIGYAALCSPSEAMIRAFNPKIKFTNVKNPMKGDDVCIERYVW